MKHSAINLAAIGSFPSFKIQNNLLPIKKLLLAVLCFFSIQASIEGQKLLSWTMSMQMPLVGGANACAVVWHPVLKKYYSSMVGNADYQMAIFDANGKRVSDSVNAGYDYRGMWYNPLTKRIEFNCYNTGGWGHLVLDATGNITGRVIDHEGLNQPGDQSTGVYYAPGNKVMFFNGVSLGIDFYKAGTAVLDTGTVVLKPGCYNSDDVEDMYDNYEEEARWDDRNLVVQYTGVKDREFAVLNVFDRMIELYSAKTGLITESYRIPEGPELNNNFNFCYCNGMFWFFHKTMRQWMAYKYVAPKVKSK